MSSRLRVGAFSDIFAAIQEEIENMYSKLQQRQRYFYFISIFISMDSSEKLVRSPEKHLARPAANSLTDNSCRISDHKMFVSCLSENKWFFKAK